MILASLYRHGLFNADPHPGNYVFRPDGSVGFLDFGCVKEFGKGQVEALVRIDEAMREFNYRDAEEGFRELGVSVGGAGLRLWLDTLYEPLTSPQPFTYTSRYATALYDSYKGLLRQVDDARGVSMPRGLLFMNRINLGVHSLLAHLRATGNWRSELDAILSVEESSVTESTNKNGLA